MCHSITFFLSFTDVYHLVFNPPKSEEIASRLIEEPGGVEENMLSNLTLYHRHSQSLLSCYGPVAKTFNVDQPINDIASQGMYYRDIQLHSLW